MEVVKDLEILLCDKSLPENMKAIARQNFGSGGGNGPKNMPTSGALTVGDRTKIQVWIDAIP